MRAPNIGKVVEIYGVTSDDKKHNFVIRKHSDGTITATEFKKSIGACGLGDRWIRVRNSKAGEAVNTCKCKCCCCN